MSLGKAAVLEEALHAVRSEVEDQVLTQRAQYAEICEERARLEASLEDALATLEREKGLATDQGRLVGREEAWAHAKKAAEEEMHSELQRLAREQAAAADELRRELDVARKQAEAQISEVTQAMEAAVADAREEATAAVWAKAHEDARRSAELLTQLGSPPPSTPSKRPHAEGAAAPEALDDRPAPPPRSSRSEPASTPLSDAAHEQSRTALSVLSDLAENQEAAWLREVESAVTQRQALSAAVNLSKVGRFVS
jgi:hypothetical protein